MNQRSIDTIVLNKLDVSNITDITRDALRYKALRRLTVGQFTALHKDALMGHDFDKQVDDLVVDMHTDKFVEKSAQQAAKTT